MRGPSLGFRFTLYAILSIVVMFLDQRHGWLEQARFVLQALAYPLQLAVGSPTAAVGWLRESLESRDALRIENALLRQQQHELELRTMRYDALARENGELRGLRDALPPVAERWLTAEIVNIQRDSLSQRILVNRGTINGVFKAQAVLDDKGVIGQTTHVGPWSAEIILITDPEHAIPVQIERTGLRTIAVGAGDTSSLALPYLPGNADIKPGDLLVTSGLGGVFPSGYPVARVSEVHRDAVQPLAQVRATPFAEVDTDREVVLVWFRPDDPAAPASTGTGDLPIGNKSLQPQPAPLRAKAPSQAAESAPQAAPSATKPADTAGSPTGPGERSTVSGHGDSDNPTATSPNASAGARKSVTPSGTVVATPAPASKKDNARVPASDGAVPVAPATPKEPAAHEGASATPKGTTQQPSDKTPRGR